MMFYLYAPTNNNREIPDVDEVTAIISTWVSIV